MQQRRVRLGDIVDDYCPRERRVTNHAVVAMIEDEVKQTRCTTCDADHEYKQARVPAPRRRKPEGVLAHDAGGAPRPRPAAAARPAVEADESDTAAEFDAESLEFALDEEMELPSHDAPFDTVEASAHAGSEGEADLDAEDDDRDDEPGDRPEDQWVHRRLIRAQLPRPEGHVPERKPTDFTIQQQSDRDGNRAGGSRQRGRGGRPQGFGQPGGQPVRHAGNPYQGGGAQRQGGGAAQRQGGGAQRQGGNRPGGQGGQRHAGRGQGQRPQGPGHGHGGQGQHGNGRRRGR